MVPNVNLVVEQPLDDMVGNTDDTALKIVVAAHAPSLYRRWADQNFALGGIDGALVCLDAGVAS